MEKPIKKPLTAAHYAAVAYLREAGSHARELYRENGDFSVDEKTREIAEKCHDSMLALFEVIAEEAEATIYPHAEFQFGGLHSVRDLAEAMRKFWSEAANIIDSVQNVKLRQEEGLK